jgi:hypothetical protein
MSKGVVSPCKYANKTRSSPAVASAAAQEAAVKYASLRSRCSPTTRGATNGRRTYSIRQQTSACVSIRQQPLLSDNQRGDQLPEKLFCRARRGGWWLRHH